MNRIKLPGKERHKRILLAVLVIITIGILFYEHNINIKEQEIKAQEEMGKASESENKPINGDSIIIGEGQSIKENKEETKGNEDIKTSKDQVKEDNSINTEIKEKKTYSQKENEIYNKAYSLFFAHDYKGAINTANELVNQFENNPMGYNIRGIAKAYNSDYEGGMADIDKALQLDDKYGYARFNKALTYELYGNMEDALKWYNKALEVEEYVWTYYGIASIYGRRGDVDNTMKYLNKAIQMNSEVKETAKEEKDFDPVKNSEAFKKVIYN
jgi:tetratricopeptide (TPR) repeat protein